MSSPSVADTSFARISSKPARVFMMIGNDSVCFNISCVVCYLSGFVVEVRDLFLWYVVLVHSSQSLVVDLYFSQCPINSLTF